MIVVHVTLPQIRSEFRTAHQTLRQKGVRALFRKYGWKLFAAVIVYYAIRDATIYILIPFLISRHFSGLL